MIAFPDMLIGAAERAGMKVPEDPDNFDKKKYPHFFCFCQLQLARPTVYHGEHFDNAKIFAKVSMKKIKTMTFDDFLKLGISWAQ